MIDQTQMRVDAAKLGTAWAGVGAVATWDWGQIAEMLAALYTVLLIADWLWRRVARPTAESRGWLQRKRRRASDRDETDRGDL